MKSRWVIYDTDNRLDCDYCGNDIEVLTQLSQDDIDKPLYQDGDGVRCVDKRCGMIGSITADEDSCYVNESN